MRCSENAGVCLAAGFSLMVSQLWYRSWLSARRSELSDLVLWGCLLRLSGRLEHH